ncbi:hypothetical protein GWN26_05155 [Candidatus Saccharibacteria bacterium]|nr:hypothetical protein [Candidatus Saccharibacteria bacterium]
MKLKYVKHILCYIIFLVIIKIFVTENQIVWYGFGLVIMFAWILENKFDELESRITKLEQKMKSKTE